MVSAEYFFWCVVDLDMVAVVAAAALPLGWLPKIHILATNTPPQILGGEKESVKNINV